MVKEAYVSFEVAKLLKEKGFDEPCHSHYWDKQIYMAGYTANFNRGFGDWLSRPTHQMAMAWLREKGVFINISVGFPYIDGKETLKYFGMPVLIHENHLEYPTEDVMTDTYDEAVEAAIKYSLENLI